MKVPSDVTSRPPSPQALTEGRLKESFEKKLNLGSKIGRKRIRGEFEPSSTSRQPDGTESKQKRSKAESSSLNVKICLQDGRKLGMTILLEDTIREVQAKLYEQFGVKSDSIMFGNQLRNKYKTCEEIGLYCGATLFIHKFTVGGYDFST
mmetsp:Transcript_9732/g.13405  ORF Transcript_9732/g.13405 Transcript_9732/m.13405 type:complete len:150 (-) Transcript_9732:369-818(-)